MATDPLVKVSFAAKATGLNKYFLYRLANAGKIPCYRAGRAIRFSIPELLEWMKTQHQIQVDTTMTCAGVISAQPGGQDRTL